MEPRTVVTTALHNPGLWARLAGGMRLEFGNLSAATQTSEGHISRRTLSRSFGRAAGPQSLKGFSLYQSCLGSARASIIGYCI